MPTYDYRCLANNRVVEVKHSMSEEILTWGELCARAALDPGNTASDSPVERLATGGQVISNNSLRNPEAPPCGAGGCGAGRCAYG